MENTTAGEAPVLNPNDAPDGYVAVESKNGLCNNCAFLDGVCKSPELAHCCSIVRLDGKEVFFVKGEHAPSAPATLLHPMGSMGEEVAL